MGRLRENGIVAKPIEVKEAIEQRILQLEEMKEENDHERSLTPSLNTFDAIDINKNTASIFETINNEDANNSRTPLKVTLDKEDSHHSCCC